MSKTFTSHPVSTHSWLLRGRFQELRGQRNVLGLSLPEDGHDPPTLAVIEQLKTVDAARERLVARRMARFVCAEDLRDVSPLLGATRDLFLEKPLRLDGALAAGGELLRREDACGKDGCVGRTLEGRNQARA